MSDQNEMDFGVYATAACNHTRRRNLPPTPDQDGFFDAAGVVEICGRRQCIAEFSGEVAAIVQFKEKKIPLTAIAPGRWDPVSILSACTRARGSHAFLVNSGTARPMNQGGLDELKIARVVAADGLKPYLTKPGQHCLQQADHGGYVVGRPRPLRMPEGFEGGMWLDDGRVASAPGNPTRAFLQVLFLQTTLAHKQSYSFRRAMRALEDVGLVRIKLGPRGGMATAIFAWTGRAYLPAPTLQQVATAHDDDLALEALAMGLA